MFTASLSNPGQRLPGYGEEQKCLDCRTPVQAAKRLKHLSPREKKWAQDRKGSKRIAKSKNYRQKEIKGEASFISTRKEA